MRQAQRQPDPLRYSHTVLGEQADALAVLPDLSVPSSGHMLATGTDGEKATCKNMASHIAFSGDFQGTSVGAGGLKTGTGDDVVSCSQTLENTAETPVFQGNQAERTGFEPVIEFYPYTGLANRRYRPLSHLSGCRHDGPISQGCAFFLLRLPLGSTRRLAITSGSP